MIEVTAEALAGHPFLHGMSRDHLAVLAETASDVTFPARHRFWPGTGIGSVQHSVLDHVLTVPSPSSPRRTERPSSPGT